MVYIDLCVIFALLLNSIISLACLKHDGEKWFSPDFTFSNCCIAGVQSLLLQITCPAVVCTEAFEPAHHPPPQARSRMSSWLSGQRQTPQICFLWYTASHSTLLFLVLRSPYPLMILLTDCFACLSSHCLYQHVAFKKAGVLSVKFTVEFLTGHFLACGMHLRLICWVNKWKQIRQPYSTEDLASKPHLHSHPPHPVSL